MKIILNFTLAIIIFSCLVVLNFMYGPEGGEFQSKVISLPPPDGMKHFTFGFGENFADGLWLRWVQSPEECGKNKIPRLVFEETFEGFKKENKDLVKIKSGWDRTKKDVCVKGWSFQMLNAIINLAPQFRMPYVSGPISLSVLADDHEGAKILFQKATEQFPQDWKFHYQLAYHYLYELDDIRLAAHHLYKASNLGAPQWTKSLASRLYSKVGQVALGILSLKQYRLSITDPDLIKKVDERIRALEQELIESKNN